MGHHVLGKQYSYSTEMGAIISAFPMIKLTTSVVYYRALINGILCTSASYMRCSNRSDHLVCIRKNMDILIGSVQVFVSFCTIDCSCSTLCHHVAVVKRHPLQNAAPSMASMQHIHCIREPK